MSDEEPRERRGAPFGFPPDILGDLGGGEEFSEVLDRTFTVSGMPRVRVRNVAGETRVRTGDDGVVLVHATKRVRGSSAEKAKRLLQNVEVRIAQHGEEIEIEPQLYEQDRGWLDLFRGGRVRVDIDVTVPRESRVEAHTVSGDVSLTGTRGPAEVQSTSGEVRVDDVQGPLRVKSVSGDVTCRECVGYVDANTVSGDVAFERSRLRDADIVTVSGDVAIEGVLEPGKEHRIRTISGDVQLALGVPSYRIEYRTMSGDATAADDARTTREGKRDRLIVLGDGASRVHVKTVSGDLTVRPAGVAVPDAPATSGPEAPRPAPERPRGDDVREVLERVARGELDVEAASAALDAADRAAPREPPPEPALPPGLRGRILRIQVTSGGASKVNIAIPLAIARMGKTKLAASGLVRGHLAKFGIDLDDVLRTVERTGPIVDISDNEDRVLIQVE